MGTLIATKGTQRLASFFNARFVDANSILALQNSISAKDMNSSKGAVMLQDAFRSGANDLLSISDQFIAQFNTQAGGGAAAGTGTYPDFNDVLYPSATMLALANVNNSATITFSLQFANATIPSFMSTVGNAVCSLDSAGIPHGTTVSAAPTLAGGIITATLSKPITVNANERICFTPGKHEQLVRRWRWYLRHDLKPEHHASIRTAISSVFDDSRFQKATFQTVEDTQRVLTKPERQLGNALEFNDVLHMHIVLMTQQTTAPDPLD